MKIIRSNQPAAQVDFSEEKKQVSLSPVLEGNLYVVHRESRPENSASCECFLGSVYPFESVNSNHLRIAGMNVTVP